MTTAKRIRNAIVILLTIFIITLTDWRPGKVLSPLHLGNRPLASNITTLVTALYDIDRHHQGRSVDEYLQWMDRTLKLRCPFIIFTSTSLAHRIQSMRISELRAHTMLITRDRIPFEEFSHFIERSVFPKFKQRMKHPADITNVNKMYAIINHAKMIWLNEAIALNPFHTETFFWIDAGFSRFIPEQYYMSSFPLSTNKIRMLASKQWAFLAVASASESEIDLSKHLPIHEFVGTNRNFVRGNFWGGHRDAVRRIATQSLAVFMEMLAHDTIDNEQLSLFFAYRRQPELFHLRRTASESESFIYIADG